MQLPSIAIVGRPNVGKSSLFNRFVGKPIAIVDPTPGVTRDRLLHEVDWDDYRFEVVDTGGIGIVDEKKLEEDVYQQVERAIALADRIVFVVDGRDGVHTLDKDIAKTLRPLGKRVVLAVNKLDHDGIDSEAAQFHQMGLGEPMIISASQGRGIDDLVERLCKGLPNARKAEQTDDEPDDGRLKVCLAGRRNVGKSSLTNALCGDNRVIVADLPGTTRDAIDVPIDRAGHQFTLIDTAGLRKRQQISEDLEFYAACRTERAVKRADVVLLVLDAADEVGAVDKKLAHFCEVEGKPTVIVVNKWDLAEQGGAKREDYVTWLRDRLPWLKYAPATFTCALTGYNIDEALRLAVELHAETKCRVSTSELNDLLQAAVQRRRPRKMGASGTKIYYGTQIESKPPTFLFFVNRTDWIEPGYGRYLENYLRERLPFQRIPLRILFKARESQYHDGKDKKQVIIAKTKSGRTASLIVPKGARRGHQMFRRRPKDDVAESEGGSSEDQVTEGGLTDIGGDDE
ncbi:MAG TPA: ribosome biogenesis GTPase Der [Planctomycetota bacterium]|nr:ribosome biogenesis GTPase Der [Planctomycetota bacterium]